MKKLLTTTLLLAASVLLVACKDNSSTQSGPTAKSDKVVQILWAKWAPADTLQKLGDEYKAATGVDVRVDQKSWSGAFADTKQQEFNNKGTTYDIIIGDSQWLGQGVTGGHFADLTDLVKQNPDLFKDYAPKAMSHYGEYPIGSGKYYGVPCMADAIAGVYRKDLFESDKHKAAYEKFVRREIDKLPAPQLVERKFMAEYGTLEVPKTWAQLALIAKYFKEASGEPNLVGIVMPTTRAYDQATMMYETILWSYGGSWGDYANNKVTIQSPEAVASLQLLKDLVAQSTPGGRDMDYGDINKTFIDGRSAMAITYFAFMPAIANSPDIQAKTGYFNLPAGPKGRFTSLGGQGISVNAHISADRQKQATDFIKWFASESTQKKWAAMGGFSAHLGVMRSDEFKKAAPYNPLAEEAFNMVDDFWANPEYDQLLEISQKEITTVLQTNGDPAAAIARIQSAQEKVLKK